MVDTIFLVSGYEVIYLPNNFLPSVSKSEKNYVIFPMGEQIEVNGAPTFHNVMLPLMCTLNACFDYIIIYDYIFH